MPSYHRLLITYVRKWGLCRRTIQYLSCSFQRGVRLHTLTIEKLAPHFDLIWLALSRRFTTLSLRPPYYPTTFNNTSNFLLDRSLRRVLGLPRSFFQALSGWILPLFFGASRCLGATMTALVAISDSTLKFRVPAVIVTDTWTIKGHFAAVWKLISSAVNCSRFNTHLRAITSADSSRCNKD